MEERKKSKVKTAEFDLYRIHGNALQVFHKIIRIFPRILKQKNRLGLKWIDQFRDHQAMEL